MYYVYIVKCNDGTLYTGITNDLERRVRQHQEGTGAKYTRSREVQLVYFEKKRNRSTASRREVAIKRLKREEKLALIKNQATSKT